MDNKLKIINSLAKHSSDEFTMHELSKITKIPYATFFRTVQQIKDLLIRRKAGKATLLQANSNNPLLKHYVIISSNEEKDEFVKKHPLIKKIAEELPSGEYTVVLFGSYAKGTQTSKSDIDLMVINQKGERKPDFSRYETIFRVQINPFYFSYKEFNEMLKDKEENVGRQALKAHIVLQNPELFWSLVHDV